MAREGSYDRAGSLFDPAAAIRQGWVERALTPDAGERRTGYSIDSYQDRLSIRAEGQRSASALVLPVDFDAEDCPYLEWDWRGGQIGRAHGRTPVTNAHLVCR